jgi:translocation and assembly module TamA
MDVKNSRKETYRYVDFIRNLFILLLFATSIAHAASNPCLIYEIHGIPDKALQNNIQARLQAIETAKKKIYPNSALEIKKAIEPFGFFRASIHSKLIKRGNQSVAVYWIKLGKQLRVTSIDTKLIGPGKDNPVLTHYLKNLPLKPQDLFTTPAYNNVKTQLFTLAKNQGYLKANFQNNIVVDLKRYTCHIHIVLETGPQYYFGHLWFETTPYSKAFMQRFIPFKPGNVFSSTQLLKIQQKMEQSYYFKRAVFRPNFAETENFQIPIHAYLYRPKAYRYSIGLGYGTLTGPRIAAGLSLRHIGNEGHHLEAELKLSSVLSGLGATYYIPGKDPLSEEWLFGANIKNFKPRMGRSNSATLTAGYSKKFETWQTSFNVNYLMEKFTMRKFPWETAHMLYPSWKLSYVVADNLIIPKHGHAVNLTVQGAAKPLLSTTSFLQAYTRIKYITSPVDFARILLRTDLGYTTVNNLYKFPLSLRFITGGETTIRGFADSSIGPGKYLFIGSAEYQNRIKDNLYGAVFYDTGYAANHVISKLQQGAGVGGVYYTQLGPVKLYVARALTKYNKLYSLEFSMGPEFS